MSAGGSRQETPAGFSIIIPAYNAAASIAEVVAGLRENLRALARPWEIIVIDDGSNDQTGRIAASLAGVRVITHPGNRGYGRSLKSGIRQARYDWVIFFDADGQHPAADLGRMAAAAAAHDAVIGIRTGESPQPLARIIGKKVLWGIMNLFLPVRIKDLNCGFRAFNRKVLSQYLHLMPDGYSFSLTSLVVFLMRGHRIHLLETRTVRGTGTSTVGGADVLRCLLQMLRLIILFFPLKLFLPLGGGLLAVALVWFRAEPAASGRALSCLWLGLLALVLGWLAARHGRRRRELLARAE